MMKNAWMQTGILLCSIAAMALPGVKSPVRIEVEPTVWRGPCPHSFRFNGTVISRGGGVVYYHWERSDGSSTPTQSTAFARADVERTLYNEWHLTRAPKQNFRGWEQLVVTKPNFIRSFKAVINLQCSR